ncbi:MAG: SIMPL domain-containing protein [Bacteroidales bacterium]|jgi:hypothetical protein|nr:SIMPL domain-containing protein [Bacteroidales bacterium]
MKKLLLLLTLSPLISFGQLTNEKTITVVGISEIEVDPDLITLSMTVRETENTKKESDIVNLENNIIQFLASIGIDKSNFTINRYVVREQLGNKFKQDKAYNLIITKPSLLDTIVTKCIEVGMDNLYVSKLDHTQIEILRNDLLIKALTSAKIKAETIAKEMGITIGKVSMVNESYKIVGDRQNDYNNAFFSLEEVYVTGYGGRGVTPVRSPGTINLEKLHLSKTVIVKYEIN